MNTKRILCFGDSNTWGWIPVSGQRYGPESRWPNILGHLLGDNYEVIADGVPGRTSAWDDSEENVLCGVNVFPRTLIHYAPLNLVLIMLGTNDLKKRFGLGCQQIAEGVGQVVKIAQARTCDGSKNPVLLIAPPPLQPIAANNHLFTNAVTTSQKLANFYYNVAQRTGCTFFNAGDVVSTSELDGVHWDKSAHITFASALKPIVESHIA